MDDHASFGYWIRRRRKALDLTQHDLARLVGCAVSTIRKIESDERRPSRQMAELLADRLVIPATDRAAFLEAARAERAVERLGTAVVTPVGLPPRPQEDTSPGSEARHTLTMLPPSDGMATRQHARALPASDAEVAAALVLEEDAAFPPAPDTVLAPAHSQAHFRRNRQKMLDKVHNWWIKGVLEQSLHGAALIVLGLRYEPEAVTHPWGMVVVEPDRAARPLTPGTSIVEVFDDLGEELLLLGEPGAGKTTMLFELARALLARAARDETLPMPVIFHLSSWSARQSIADWLVDELGAKYQVPRRIGRAWIQTGGVVLPLLDGLDEVRADQRDACVDALNRFRHEHGLDGMVICSRAREYRTLTARLHLQGAIYLQPLTPEQIDAYLSGFAGEGCHLKELLQTQPALRELAQSPLMLTIMILAYRDTTLASVPHLDIAQQQAHVFATYVKQMIQRRGLAQQYAPAQIAGWLAWLAQQLVQRDQTLFLIERMAPDWLPTRRQQWIHALWEGLAVGLIAGAGTALVYGMRSLLPNVPHQGPGNDVLAYAGFSRWVALEGVSAFTPILWLAALLLVGLAIGLATGLAAGLVIVPTLPSFPLVLRIAPSLRRAIRNFLHIGLAAGGAAALVATLFVGPAGGLFELVGTGVVAGVAAVLAAQPGTLNVVETLGWSWRKAARGLVASSLMVVVWLLSDQIMQGWESVIYRAGDRVVVYTLALGLAAGITSGEIEVKTRANQGMWRSARNAVTVGLAAWCLVSLVGGLIHTTMTNPLLRIISGIEFGLAAGVVMSLGWGGFVCLQHLVLRVMLWRSSLIPWNYVRFLDAASDSLLLRKVGGGYIFVHRLLMEHFATSKTA